MQRPSKKNVQLGEEMVADEAGKYVGLRQVIRYLHVKGI